MYVVADWVGLHVFLWLTVYRYAYEAVCECVNVF